MTCRNEVLFGLNCFELNFLFKHVEWCSNCEYDKLYYKYEGLHDEKEITPFQLFLKNIHYNNPSVGDLAERWNDLTLAIRRGIINEMYKYLKINDEDVFEENCEYYLTNILAKGNYVCPLGLFHCKNKIPSNNCYSDIPGCEVCSHFVGMNMHNRNYYCKKGVPMQYFHKLVEIYINLMKFRKYIAINTPAHNFETVYRKYYKFIRENGVF